MATKTDNPSTTILCLLSTLGIRVTLTTIRRSLENHRDKMSLLAISDTLYKLNIANAAYNIDKEDIFHIPVPFIAHLNSHGGEFVTIKEIQSDSIVVTNERWKDDNMPLQSFFQSFSGSILCIDPSNKAGELNYWYNRGAEIFYNNKIIISILTILLVATLKIANNINYFTSIKISIFCLLFVKILGIVITSLLIKQNLLKDNNLDKLCKSVGSDCSEITHSLDGYLFGGHVSWSEMGLLYFFGTTVSLIFNFHSTETIRLLLAVNGFCLLFSFYSVYYQMFVAKKWCLLCISVQIIFWLEFLFIILSLVQIVGPISSNTFINMIAGMIFPALLWFVIKPELVKAISEPDLQKKLIKFTRNKNLFTYVMNKQKRHELIQSDSIITLGDNNAVNVVTIVSNPFCQPCANIHKHIEEVLIQSSNIKIQLLFFTKNQDEKSLKIVKIFHYIYMTEGADILHAAIDEWYKSMNFDQWVKKFPNVIYEDEWVLVEQNNWCDYINLEYTPTLLLNGAKVPSPYDITLLPNLT